MHEDTPLCVGGFLQFEAVIGSHSKSNSVVSSIGCVGIVDKVDTDGDVNLKLLATTGFAELTYMAGSYWLLRKHMSEKVFVSYGVRVELQG